MKDVTRRAERTTALASMAERMRAAGFNVAERFAGASSSNVNDVAAGNVQREGLCRTVPFRMSLAPETNGTDETESDGRTIEGYGAVFGVDTEINSWEGHFNEKIRKGAFRKSIRENTPKMQFDHGYHPLLGGLPLGRWETVEEDDHGLHVLGRMYDNWLIEPFRMAIAEGAVDGMSFRFSVVKEEWRDNDGKVIKDDHELFELLYYGAGDRGPITRELIEVRVPEVGPVVWPAYQETEVGARSADGGRLVIDLGALREDRGALADLVALMDCEAGKARRLEVVAALGIRVADAGGDTAPVVPPDGDSVHNGAVHTGRSRSTEGEPQTTGTTAGNHSQREPGTTDATAGTHSRSGDTPDETRPLNPTDRRNTLRSDYRTYLDRALTLPPSDE